jgi:hypothetical protein
VHPTIMRLFLFSFATLVLSCALRSNAAELKDALFPKVYRDLWPGFFGFTPVNAGAFGETTGTEQTPERMRRLSDRSNGRPRYEALDFLRNMGIPSRPGQSAIYLPDEKVLILNGTSDDQDLAERMFDAGFSCGGVKQLELTVSAWAYLDTPDALVNNNARTFEEIRAIAGASLRPVDAHLILTRSGNRAISHHLAGAEEASKPSAPADASAPLKSPGSTLELEPVIGPDGISIDIQVEYRARIPQPNARDLCFSLSTNATMNAGTNMIVQNLHFPPTDGQSPGKVRRGAIIVSARILEVVAPKVMAEKLSAAELERRNRQLIADAFEGLPELTPKQRPGERSSPK